MANISIFAGNLKLGCSYLQLFSSELYEISHVYNGKLPNSMQKMRLLEKTELIYESMYIHICFSMKMQNQGTLNGKQFCRKITRNNIANVFIPGFLWEYDKKILSRNISVSVSSRFFLWKSLRSVISWHCKCFYTWIPLRIWQKKSYQEIYLSQSQLGFSCEKAWVQ